MGWKNNGKLAAPMWDHYRVQHACNNGKAIEKLQFRCVTTMEKHGNKTWKKKQNRLYGATVGLVGGAFGYALDTLR